MTAEVNGLAKAEAQEVACLACSGRRVERVGRLPSFVAGQIRRREGGEDEDWLYRCLDCTLRFRWPLPTEQELLDYYSGLCGEEWWQNEAEREVWARIKSELEAAPEKTVLDVGCFRGDFLNYLGAGWRRFGVEPSADARRVAEERGIKVIADSLDALDEEGPRFGAITLIDVIEHLPRPLESLRRLERRLLPGGRLVIFTGSTDALSWRLAGTDYWYCAMPEHIAFFRPSWFSWAAPRLNCRYELLGRMAYKPAPLRTRIDEALRNTAFIASRRLSRRPRLGATLGRLPLAGRIARWDSCWWTSARDHVLVSFAKPPEAASPTRVET
jgi:SAM-dependent methyltransferase